jgi:hypothetical protein
MAITTLTSGMEPDEWIALFVWLLVWMLPIIVFYIGACGHHWKLWYSYSEFKPPLFPGPILHISLIGFSNFLYAIGAFMVWKIGRRQIIQNPGGDMDSPNLYYAFMILNVVLIAMECMSGPIMWDFQAFGLLYFFVVIQLILSITCVAIGITIWPYSFYMVLVPLMWLPTIYVVHKITMSMRMGDKAYYVPDHLSNVWRFVRYLNKLLMVENFDVTKLGKSKKKDKSSTKVSKSSSKSRDSDSNKTTSSSDSKKRSKESKKEKEETKDKKRKDKSTMNTS